MTDSGGKETSTTTHDSLEGSPEVEHTIGSSSPPEDLAKQVEQSSDRAAASLPDQDSVRERSGDHEMIRFLATWMGVTPTLAVLIGGRVWNADPAFASTINQGLSLTRDFIGLRGIIIACVLFTILLSFIISKSFQGGSYLAMTYRAALTIAALFGVLFSFG